MAIDFTQIPDNLLVPGNFQEIDNSLAGTSEEAKRVLIVGLRTGGTAEVNTVTAVNSGKDADKKFGAGSPAARMSRAFLEGNQTEQLYVLPLEEKANSSASGAGARGASSEGASSESGGYSKHTITFGKEGTDISSGTFTRYIDGERVSTTVKATTAKDTNSLAEIAEDFAKAVNGAPNMPVAASHSGANKKAEVTLTAKAKGETGNTIVVAGGLAGERDPDGLQVSITQAPTEVKNPSLGNTLEEMEERRYHYLISDLNDQTNIKKFSEFLEKRYSATKQIGGRLFIALSGEVGSSEVADSMIGQAGKLNSPHIVALARGKNHNSPGIFASRIAAKVIRRLADDPAANTYGIEVTKLLVNSPINFDDRKGLLKAGIATVEASITGTVTVERLVTTYTSDNEGNRDTSYLDVQITETVDAIRTYINSAAAKRFSSWKLSSTNETFGKGAKVMTPGVWKAFLVDLYQNVFIAEKQWCQDFKRYKKSIVASVLSGSKTRLEYRHQPVLIGQFLQSTGHNQFV